MDKLNKQGFTMVEILIVVAIVAVLVSVIVPTVIRSTTRGKGAADAANIRSMTAQAAIEALNEDGDRILTAGKVFDSKVYGKGGHISWIEASGGLTAFVDAGGKMDLTLEHFVKVSQTGLTD